MPGAVTATRMLRTGRSGALRRQAATLALLACPALACAQSVGQGDVVVQGQRGSVIGDIKPLAQLDSRAIAGTGAATMADLLKAIAPMTRSANGGEPIYLINGQRTAGYQEVGTLPPEAIVNVEVLPEQAALKFGYPATRTIVNFITKPRFAQIEARAYAGQAAGGGNGTGDAFGGFTRIANGRRLSLTGEYRHADALLQSERHIRPDPDNPFDAIGNVTAADGGEIDPTLSQTASHPVLIAAVPVDPAQRNRPSGYLAGAGRPRSFDLGPYRTLVGRTDEMTFNGVFATPLSNSISSTFSASADRSADRSLQGLPAVAILVPAGSAFSPFGKGVLLDRYLAESKALVLNAVTTKLNAGAALHGTLGRWMWDLTGSFDENEVSNHGPALVDVAAIDRAVAAGADPFAPIAPALLANRVRQQSRSLNRKGDVKAVASGVALHLPAGDATLTATAEAERATAHSSAHGLEEDALSIGRTRAEAGLALDLPLASRDAHVLPFLNSLSLSLSANVRRVEGYGTLSDTSYGFAWSPTGRLQVIGTIRRTDTAPDMALRSAPVVRTANVPFFDALAGRSVPVITISGGNPNLAAEQRTARTLNFAWQPLASGKLFLRLNYSDEVIRNQALQVTALTPATQAAFPSLFVRDAAGRLTTVLFQPINFYRERQRMLVLSGNFHAQLGKPPPKAADPKQPPPARPSLLFGGAVTPILQDRLQLRPGSPVLNLANGGTYDASASKRRIGVYSWTGINYRSMGVDLDEQWISGIRIRGGSPQTDLHFAPLLKLNLNLYASLESWFPHRLWARRTNIFLSAENLFDQRQRVHDGTGATPNRYQPDYLDPVGTMVKFTVRRLF